MQKILPYTLLVIISSIICVPKPVDAGQLFYLRRPKLALDFIYETTKETRKGNNIDSEDVTNNLKESFTVETEGWVYHPALLDFQFGLEPVWSQAKEDHSTGPISTSNDIDTYTLGYFFNASIFQFKPYTLQVFARNQSNDTTSSFGQRSKAETKTYGTNLSLKYITLSTSLGYTHNDTKQSGFYNYSSQGDEVRLNMKLPKKTNETELNVSFVDKDQNTNNTLTNIETLDSELSNKWEFSNEKRRNLLSSLRYRETDGTYTGYSGIIFNQTLFWEHTESLNSNLNGHYSESESGNFETETKSLGAGVSYNILKNLDTKFSLNGSDQQNNLGDESSIGAELGLNYRHTTSIGTFSFNSNHNYKLRYRDVVNGFIQSSNEPHILNSTDLVFLNQKNINRNSITVTNQASTITYIENIDYTITELLPFLRINRNLLGAIADGQNVLVNYSYENPSAYDDAIFSQSYGINYAPLKSLSFLYQYNRSEQIHKGGIAPDNLDKSTLHTCEATWDVKWLRSKFSFQDSNKNSGNSNTRWTIDETISYTPSHSFFLMLSAKYGKTKFEGNNDNETFYSIRSQIDYAPKKSWKLSFEGFMNGVEGTSVDTLDRGASLNFNLYYGIWSGQIECMYVNEENLTADESRDLNSITLKISRRLW